MNAQADLFPDFPPDIPGESPPRVLCVRIDATTLLDGTEAVRLVCPQCGYDRGWWKPQALRKGVECPQCTPPPQHRSRALGFVMNG